MQPAPQQVPPAPVTTGTGSTGGNNPSAVTESNESQPPSDSGFSQVQSPSQLFSNDALHALIGMGFPESESRAALNAAMGNPDLAYEFLLTGIPEHARGLRTGSATPSRPTGIDQLRLHPQFNMLKQLIQQNPAALSQVLNLIGQQDPALLQAIHENNDAFIAMMNEPIEGSAPTVPQPAPVSHAANPVSDPTQIFQLLAAMPADQRAQFAQSMGLSADQLEGVMQMMAQLPPTDLHAMLGRGPVGRQHADPPGVIRLTEDEIAAVNRLVAMGFTQQQAAQAYLACDKNEMLAANLLIEGGWALDDDDVGPGNRHGDDEDDMYH